MIHPGIQPETLDLSCAKSALCSGSKCRICRHYASTGLWDIPCTPAGPCSVKERARVITGNMNQSPHRNLRKQHVKEGTLFAVMSYPVRAASSWAFLSAAVVSRGFMAAALILQGFRGLNSCSSGSSSW